MSEWFENLKLQFDLNFIQKDRWQYLLTGLGNTLRITLFACLIGIALGTLIAIVRSTSDRVLPSMRKGLGRTLLNIVDKFCRVYLTVIRGTPVVIQLMICYYVIFSSSRNGVAIAAISFGLNSAAYVAEIVRSGIQAIDAGQSEASRSLGMTSAQTMLYIILPQAIKNILPAVGNEFVVIIKESSILYTIGIYELTYQANKLASTNFRYLETLMISALVYFVLTFTTSRLLGLLERRMRRGDR